MYRIAFDVETKRPGCVLIQATLGGTVPGHIFHELFPSETWQIYLGNCQVYNTTEEQLQQLSVMARKVARAEK